MIDILLFSSQLSPKKTWEGFIGGGVTTVIYGWLVSHFMCQYQYFVCPVEVRVYESQYFAHVNPEFCHLVCKNVKK